MMNILLVGYGKMGKAIEQVALQRSHKIVHKISADNTAYLSKIDQSLIDVAIEFSHPESAYDNVYQCLSKGIPVVCGTTGWLARLGEVEQYCKAQKGAFFYASNFSIGMHILAKVNAFLANIMNTHPEYDVAIEEVHHLEKKDAPSGTAITLANDMIHHLSRKHSWRLGPSAAEQELAITARREPEVPGVHTVSYKSDIDTLTLQHTAHSRMGFAMGAVSVAEWICNKEGIFGMEDFLKLDKHHN